MAFLPPTTLPVRPNRPTPCTDPRHPPRARWGGDSSPDWSHAWDASRHQAGGWSQRDPRWRDPSVPRGRNYSSRHARADRKEERSEVDVSWERDGDWDIVSCGDAIAVVWFFGTVGACEAPRGMYGAFLEEVCRRGRVVVAAARGELGAGWRVDEGVRERFAGLGGFGVGHGTGGRVLLNGGLREVEVDGNVFIGYTGMSAREMMPMLEWVPEGCVRDLERVGEAMEGLEVEGREQVEDLLRVVGGVARFVVEGSRDVEGGEEDLEGYQVENNLVVCFDRDGMDGSEGIVNKIEGCVVRKICGVHLTPVTIGESGDGGVSTQVESLIDVVVEFVRLKSRQG